MIVVSLAEFRDCDDLVNLEERCFEYEQLTRLRFLYHIGNRNCYLLIARLDKEVVGYGMLLFHSRRTRGRIYSICTAPEFRGRGVASAILDEIERIARQKGKGVSLEVRKENTIAQKLYASRGFALLGCKKKYYTDGCDALVMCKDFEKKSSFC